MIFLNTDNVGTKESWKNERIQNLGEAEIVRQTVEAFCESGVPESDMGVITVYRSQLKILQQGLRQRKGVEVLTADRFQGRDKNCIIISLVRANEKGVVGDLLRDWRRLNVTFTRAKSKLIIVGSGNTLETAEALNGFLKLIESKGWVYNLPERSLEFYNFPSPLPTPKAEKHKKYSPSKVSQSQPATSPTPKKHQGKTVLSKKALSKKPFLAEVLNEVTATPRTGD